MTNYRYLFEDYIKRMNESLEDNNYPLLIPTYYPEDFEDDDSYDFLWNDSAEWDFDDKGTLDNSEAVTRGVYYFSIYLWFYYDKNKDKEDMMKHFWKDFLAYSFDNLNYEMKSLRKMGFRKEYNKYLTEYLRYDDSDDKGNPDDWSSLIDVIIPWIGNNSWGKERTIYRVICPIRDNGKEKIDTDRIGNCWALDMNSALRFVGKLYNHVEGDTHPYLIKAKCSTRNIDWVVSALLKLEYTNESEVRIIDTSKIYDIEVFDLEDKEKHKGYYDDKGIYFISGVND